MRLRLSANVWRIPEFAKWDALSWKDSNLDSPLFDRYSTRPCRLFGLGRMLSYISSMVNGSLRYWAFFLQFKTASLVSAVKRGHWWTGSSRPSPGLAPSDAPTFYRQNQSSNIWIMVAGFIWQKTPGLPVISFKQVTLILKNSGSFEECRK